MKARVTDPDPILSRLNAIGVPRRRYVKEDQYYGPSDSLDGARYRIRRDDDQRIVTVKEKSIHDGIEENREIEFTVSDADAMERVFRSLGLRRVITKRKRGEAFSVEGVLVECSHVDHVGWFVELELVLSDDAGRDEIAAARDRLRRLLDQLDIPSSAVESRSYNQMIYEATHGTGSLSRGSV